MSNHLNILPKQSKFDFKCSKMRWRLQGSTPDPAGGAYDAPPDLLAGRGFAPSALAKAPPLTV